MGTGRGGGPSPSRRAWLGGAPAWGPLWEPPQYRGGSSSRFKVELIQRGQPSHLETQKELELALGEEGQLRRSFPTGAFAPGSQASRGALPGTGCSPNRHHNGGKLNESSCLWLWPCAVVRLLSPLEAQRGEGTCPRSHSFLRGFHPSF